MMMIMMTMMIRYWASLVRLDRQREGTLPPHSFPILLIYFLQQQSKPVLPCIHSYTDSDEASQPYTRPHQVGVSAEIIMLLWPCDMYYVTSHIVTLSHFSVP